ncbi:ribose-5-phosphate isomerase [Candidatus Nitrososphaera evergladensis SR1]|jgi:ribose 5-phosphate isomerase A|uniref:Ribose 5-phosphate isomerase A n=2 Tax=Nitrososphaera TaxID=497726 RepID=A0A075MR11_9ARCH|nr:ribose-5-phosphate isomerase [Candidatus Nitrososphaera evergladensis SR1]
MLQDAIQKLAKDTVSKFVKPNQVVGLGSGSTAAYIVREMASLKAKDTLLCIPTSLQIKVEAEKSGLRFADESRIPDIDVVFDGADQIDGRFNMIKGGGGALLREKILISSAKTVVIVADEAKFVKSFSRSVPIEVHPMARTSVAKRLEKIGAKPAMRTLDKGYPFITENGNIILDTVFPSISDPERAELELKGIPGVMEVGMFTRKTNVYYYRAKSDGTFELVNS